MVGTLNNSSTGLFFLVCLFAAEEPFFCSKVNITGL